MYRNVALAETEDGLTGWHADEAVMRLDASEITAAERIDEDADTWWARAVAWRPTLPGKLPSMAELQEQITMLTDCLLEMSEIVYGE